MWKSRDKAVLCCLLMTTGSLAMRLVFLCILTSYPSVQDMDDMDADLFSSKKKPSSAPARTNPSGNKGPKKDSAALESKPEGEGNSVQSVLA